MASDDVNRIQQRFADKAEFLLVYLREAHPKDGWAKEGFSLTISDPQSQGERNTIATQCGQELQFNFPIVVDTMDDATAVDYAAWPERIFVIDEQGRIAYAGHQGPWGFWPSHHTVRKRINPRTGELAVGDTLEVFLERKFLAEAEPFDAP